MGPVVYFCSSRTCFETPYPYKTCVMSYIPKTHLMVFYCYRHWHDFQRRSKEFSGTDVKLLKMMDDCSLKRTAENMCEYEYMFDIYCMLRLWSFKRGGGLTAFFNQQHISLRLSKPSCARTTYGY